MNGQTTKTSVSLSLLAVFVGTCLPVPGIYAQQTAGKPPERFEVASIKPSHSAMPGSVYSIRTLPDRFEAEHVTLFELIRFAYEPGEGELGGGAGWIRSDRFDVVAKVAGRNGEAAAASSQRLMLRKLLSERFGLTVHYDTRELPIFVLTVGPTGQLGTGLKASTTACAAGDTTPAPPIGPIGCGMLSLPAGRLRAGGVTLDQIARLLARIQDFHSAVINETGLVGNFDLDLRWTPEWVRSLVASFPSLQGPSSRQDAGAIDPNGPSIFAAIKEQLGLKLESRRSPRNVLSIDSASQPSSD